MKAFQLEIQIDHNEIENNVTATKNLPLLLRRKSSQTVLAKTVTKIRLYLSSFSGVFDYNYM